VPEAVWHTDPCVGLGTSNSSAEQPGSGAGPAASVEHPPFIMFAYGEVDIAKAAQRHRRLAIRLHLQGDSLGVNPFIERFDEFLLREFGHCAPEIVADGVRLGGAGAEERGQERTEIVPAALAKLFQEPGGPTGAIHFQTVAPERTNTHVADGIPQRL